MTSRIGASIFVGGYIERHLCPGALPVFPLPHFIFWFSVFKERTTPQARRF